MQYKSNVVYARYMGRGKLFSKGKVYKLKIHEVEMNWFENLMFGLTGKIKDILKVKLCRIGDKKVGPCINYLDKKFFEDDWKLEPNWYAQSQNRKK